MNGEPDGNTVVGTKTVDVVVNPTTGSVVLDPSSVTLSAEGERVTYTLSLAPGSGEAEIRAYVALLKKDKLVPDAATGNDGYQDFVFAITDQNGTELKPTFIAVAEGEVRVLVTVLFPEGSSHAFQPDESVVIMDW